MTDYSEDTKHVKTVNEDAIAYPDASVLLRSEKIQGPGIVVAIIVIALAVAVAAWGFYQVADVVVLSKQRETAQIETNISRDVSYDFVQLKDYVGWSSGDVASTIENDYGYGVVYIETQEDYDNLGFDLYKLPSDVTVDEGTTMLADGISALNAPEASKLFKGGWRLTMDLTSYFDIKIRYVDFESASLEDALVTAINNQGLTGDNCELTEEGIDDSGNTYKSGTITIDDTNYFWRASAIMLDDIYSINGMPESAIYVGVRLTN